MFEVIILQSAGEAPTNMQRPYSCNALVRFDNSNILQDVIWMGTACSKNRSLFSAPI